MQHTVSGSITISSNHQKGKRKNEYKVDSR